MLRKPWQNGPTELIRHAIEHMNLGTDLDMRIAFLLLDVGTETMFKTYLLLSNKNAKTEMKYSERKAAAEGDFHDVIEGIGKAAGKRLGDIDLGEIEYYHSLRNKLYHDGNGITVPPEKVNGYARVAVDILEVLLNVDIHDELAKPEKEQQRKIENKLKLDRLESQIQDVKKAITRVNENILLLLEKLEPQLVLPSFTKNFYKYIKDEHGLREKSQKEYIDFVLDHIQNPEIRASVEDLFREYPTGTLIPIDLYLFIVNLEYPSGELDQHIKNYRLAYLFPDPYLLEPYEEDFETGNRVYKERDYEAITRVARQTILEMDQFADFLSRLSDRA